MPMWLNMTVRKPRFVRGRIESFGTRLGTRPIDFNLTQAVREHIIWVKQNVTRDFWREVVNKTPSVTGRTRGSWKVTVDKIDSTYLPRAPVRDSTYYTKPRFPGSKIRYIQPETVIYVTNSCPWIGGLENGSSTLAPAGFIKAAQRKVINKYGVGFADGAPTGGRLNLAIPRGANRESLAATRASLSAGR